MAIIINVSDKLGTVLNTITLEKGVITIGRSSKSNFPIDDPSLSKIHCTIELTEQGKVFFEDKDSSNGSIMHSSKIKHAELKINDRIRIGKHYLQLDEAQLTPRERFLIGKSKIDQIILDMPEEDKTVMKTNKLVLSRLGEKKKS